MKLVRRVTHDITGICTGLFWLLQCTAAIFTTEDAEYRVAIAPREMKVVDQEVATFVCVTNIDHTPSLVWRRNGRRLDHGGNYQIFKIWGGSVLRIEPVRARRDDAFFECIVETAENEPYTDSALLRVYPRTEKPSGYPEITLSPGFRMIEEDNWAILDCEVEGTPHPDVVWLKDFAPLDMQDLRYRILESGSLEISYLENRDDGTYECVAENELGVAYSDPGRIFVEDYTWPD